jgi:NAD(P)-dependent dehydrogenase (short-subunit alcohol dehydrogenase family)
VPRLFRKIVLVVGAASSIGQAIAELLNAKGATIVLSDIMVNVDGGVLGSSTAAPSSQSIN